MSRNLRGSKSALVHRIESRIVHKSVTSHSQHTRDHSCTRTTAQARAEHIADRTCLGSDRHVLWCSVLHTLHFRMRRNRYIYSYFTIRIPPPRPHTRRWIGTYCTAVMVINSWPTGVMATIDGSSRSHETCRNLSFNIYITFSVL